jgi:hypothetical protein
MTDLLTISTQDTINTLATNVVHREREVHQYQINIDNYVQMLSAMPTTDIPAVLAPYINTQPDDLPLEMDIDDVMLISKYQYKDRLTKLLRTERIEQSKAKAILDSLKAQLPADQLDTLVADALVKVNAQSAPSA